MIDTDNPFALVKASDYTDAQINSLWVDLGKGMIESLIDPRSKVSKFLLGGKGTGKTHLLRYLSYPVTKLRNGHVDGIKLIQQQKFLAVFLRATGIDASRFNLTNVINGNWQQLFGIYFELKLLETLIFTLLDIKNSSQAEQFNDLSLVQYLSEFITSPSYTENIKTLEAFHEWVTTERKNIDTEINNAAFTGSIDIKIPFSIGSLSLNISAGLSLWHPIFIDTPLVYLIDEIENLNSEQQEVINTLIRYSENKATFRVTGRLYALKTLKTIGGGEENRAGAEFNPVCLDDILREHRKFSTFANHFIIKRLAVLGTLQDSKHFKARDLFQEIDTSNFYQNEIGKLNFKNKTEFIDSFSTLLGIRNQNNEIDINVASKISKELTENLPLLIQKLNILLFSKKYKKSLKNDDLLSKAKEIRKDSELFIAGKNSQKYFKTAYDHYANDLFAQLCRSSSNDLNVPYAGLDTFIKMSSGNPRNLLIILGMAYSIARFRNIDFIKKLKLSIDIQTQAALEAANFIFDVDTNLGTQTEAARIVTNRIATILRTARYSLNIPEVSPLAFSFEDEDLTPESKENLKLALNYSYLFEIKEGRPDRNSQKLHRKIQLNPLLSPRWGLSIGRRGDIKINAELLNSIFDVSQSKAFEINLKKLDAKWSNPFKAKNDDKAHQPKLF